MEMLHDMSKYVLIPFKGKLAKYTKVSVYSKDPDDHQTNTGANGGVSKCTQKYLGNHV